MIRLPFGERVIADPYFDDSRSWKRGQGVNRGSCPDRSPNPWPAAKEQSPRLVCTLARHLRFAHRIEDSMCHDFLLTHGDDCWRQFHRLVLAHQAKFSAADVSTGHPVVHRSGIPLPLSLMPSVPEKVLTCARPLPHQRTPSFGWSLPPRASALPAQSALYQAERVQLVIVVP